MGSLKQSSDQYRTFEGERYLCWMCYPSSDLIKAYKEAGISCVRRGTDLYVREGDTEAAVEIDKKRGLA